MCMNDKCPMFQMHNIANEAAFSWGTLEGSYQCSNACNILKDNGVGHLELLNGIVTTSYSLFGIRVSTYAF